MFGCGQCLPCRINRRRTWTHRIMLEAAQHGDNSFWTLTYDDAEMPLTKDGKPTLEPKHLTDFLKRLRFAYQPRKLRYFNVGEYGEKTERPHYHLALFNFPHCERGLTAVNRRGDCCRVCDYVRKVWAKGIVHSGHLEDASAAYIAGYITKKMTAKDDPRLCGRHPEFARMSLRPGIGAGFMPEVASALLSHNLEKDLIDVPTSLQHGRYVRPLGRYLTRQLRKHVGREENAPQATLEKQREKLQNLREISKIISPLQGNSETFKSLILQANEGRFQRLQAKQNLTRKRGTI